MTSEILETLNALYRSFTFYRRLGVTLGVNSSKINFAQVHSPPNTSAEIPIRTRLFRPEYNSAVLHEIGHFDSRNEQVVGSNPTGGSTNSIDATERDFARGEVSLRIFRHQPREAISETFKKGCWSPSSPRMEKILSW